MSISPLDCEHLKDKGHLLLCLYNPKECSWHTVSSQKTFVDFLMTKNGLNVRNERKEESEKTQVLWTREGYSLSTGKKMVTAELLLQEGVLLSLIRHLWCWGENETLRLIYVSRLQFRKRNKGASKRVIQNLGEEGDSEYSLKNLFFTLTQIWFYTWEKYKS